VTRAVVVRHCARPEGADDNERLIKAVTYPQKAS
jgi:hypothetical protein